MVNGTAALRSVPIADTQSSILGFLSAGAGGGVNDPYVLPCCFEIDGPVDVERFSAASHGLALRHDALRTRFNRSAEGWQQQVPESTEVDFAYRVLDGPDAGRTAWNLVEQEVGAGFDLSDTAPYRVRLYRTGDERHLVLFLFHHVICDGWSRTVALRDFGALYRQSPADRVPVRQYPEFVAWQHEQSGGEPWQRHLDYWTERFRHHSPGGSVVEASARRDDYTAGQLRLTVPEEAQTALTEAGRPLGLSPYLVHAAAWALAVGDVFGPQSFTLASPVALRHRPGWTKVVGDLTNMLLSPLTLDRSTTTADLLRAMHREHFEALRHVDVHYQRTMRGIGRPADYHVRIGYHTQPATRLDLDGAHTRELPVPSDHATRRLVSLELEASGSAPDGMILYRSALVSQGDAIGLRTAYLSRLKNSITTIQGMTHD